MPADIRSALAQPELWDGDIGSHVLSQAVLPRVSGVALRLYLARPRDADGSVIYMLDGGALPGLMVPDLLNRHPRLAVVAVGHDTPRAFAPADRYCDYTPRLRRDEAAALSHATGGAAAFAALLGGVVRKEAEGELDLLPTRRSLWGHSVAGLFVLARMLADPRPFDRYVAASPSVWIAEATMAAMAAAPPDLAGKRLLITFGDREHRSGLPPLERPRLPPATLRFEALLAGRGALEMRREVFEGAQHGPALALSLPHAMEAAAAP